MSYNSNFHSNFRPRFTFQQPNLIPPPPIPPAFFIPPGNPQQSDQEYVKQFDRVPTKPVKFKTKHTVSINAVKEQLRNLVLVLTDLKNEQNFLRENISDISEEEWFAKVSKIEDSKVIINHSLAEINDKNLDILRKLLAKRSAKRLRLKRVKIERKNEKEKRIKQLEERSRKIDENLQKIKDDITRAKREEEAKIEADFILKETLRKKHDAKKCITKLDALLKLYRARQNTARGRGDTISERDATVFNSNIDKLKSLWIQKLQLYEKEESELRATLSPATGVQKDGQPDVRVADTLGKWRELLFGADYPQRDFQRDVGKFVAVRSLWDQYIHPEGSVLPVGWVLPELKKA